MTTWVSIFIIPSTVGQLNLQTKQTFSCQHRICPRRARSFWPLGPELTWPRSSNFCSHTAASASASQSCLERPGNTRPWGSTCAALALGTNRVGAQICGGARGGAPAVPEPKQFAMILQFQSRAGHVFRNIFRNSEDILCKMTCQIT